MNYLNAEQIATQADGKYGVANVRAINALYRAQDESHLWPIRNKFNATERAIRNIRKLSAEMGGLAGLEYCYALEGELSRIVNGAI